jgi:hypothetical protein
VGSESREARVPVGADARHPIHRDAERLGRQLVARLPALTAALDEAGFVEGCEMLGDGLPRNRELGRELRRRRGVARGERLQHVAPVRIRQRVEDAPGRVAHT